MKLSKLRASTSTRTVRGQSVPRENTTSFGMRAALKKGGSKYAGDASGPVEGEAARARLDRPGRKAGGRVCKADGGETPYKRDRAAGELDEGAQGDYVKREADKARKETDAATGIGTTLAGVGSGVALAAKRKALPIAAALTGVGSIMAGAKRNETAKKLEGESKAFDKADRENAGQRKFGGRAKRKDGDCD